MEVSCVFSCVFGSVPDRPSADKTFRFRFFVQLGGKNGEEGGAFVGKMERESCKNLSRAHEVQIACVVGVQGLALFTTC